MTLFIDYYILTRTSWFCVSSNMSLGIKICCLPNYPIAILFIKLWKGALTIWSRYFELWWKHKSYFFYYNVLMTNEMNNSCNQFYSTVFRLFYMFRTNLVVHHQEHGIMYCITQLHRLYCVIQYIMLMMNN